MKLHDHVRHLVLAAAVLLTASGCASQAVFNFTCTPGAEINGGLLLTIDVVAVDASEEQAIRQLGDEWFYSDLRRSVGRRKETIGVEDGCRETIVMPRTKGYDRLAVIADYQFEGRSREKTQMEFYAKSAWQGKTLRIQVLDRYLTITQER